MSVPVSIAMCCNFYNDALALRGLLETSAPYFDNLFCINAGPGGAYSNDGSIELCEQFGATVVFDDIQRGFGAIRTRLLHDCGCTFGMILDADERFHPILPVLHCEGTEKFPDVAEPNLSCHRMEGVCNQGALLKRLVQDPSLQAIRATRRHWFEHAMRKPAQNWLFERDHQLRIVRNSPDIVYKSDVVMHEKLIDLRTNADPKYSEQHDYEGPFIDHYHLHYRRVLPGFKQAREENYRRLERGEPMLP